MSERNRVALTKPPAFQFYPRDFLTDERVVLMSHTERGIYITLLSLCWLETSLPVEPDALAKLVNLPLTRFLKIWERSPIRPCFQLHEDGRLHHKRLDAERAKQQKYSRTQSVNAQARWDASAHAIAVPEPCPRVADSKLQTQTLSEKGSGEKPDRSSAELDLGRRAGALIERYALWYTELRDGAKLRLVGSPLEFQDACSLCALWDDAHLEKLARVFLTSNDTFIASTDRSFKIFAMKATWADDRLRQWAKENQVAV